MSYDPQKNRRRPAPTDAGPAPVDALIRDEASAPRPIVDDPPAGPAVTPPVADPPSDSLLAGTGLGIAAASLAFALLLRYWWRRKRSATDEG